MEPKEARPLLANYREEFPVTKDFVYLDHAGVSPIPLRTVEAVRRFLVQASTKGLFSYDAWVREADSARAACAELIGACREEVSFVKNTSHGISIVARGLRWVEGDNLVIADREFPSNVYPWLALRGRGVDVRTVPLRDDGSISLDDVERMIDSRTRLVSVSSVQYWNGFRVNLEALGDLCSRKGVYLFVDAIQSLGAVPMDVGRFKIDFLAADGHKWLLAPEGTGVFYCRKGLEEELDPPLLGWKSVEDEYDYDTVHFKLKPNALRFEEGSLNFMGIMALGASVQMLLEVGIDRVHARITELCDMVIAQAESRGYAVRTPRDKESRAGIISFVGDFNPQEVKEKLKEKGAMVNVRGGGLRVSPHFYNSDEDIMVFFDLLDGALGRK
jgi:selenocysteine lyase/cysteine desulfurase